MKDNAQPKRKRFPIWRVIGAIILYVCCCYLEEAFQQARESGMIQDAREISLMLFQYAADNGGKYPTGQTSTEVFQKLIDGGYVTDPKDPESPRDGVAIFYEDLPGKTKPSSKQLKPENVAWDLASPVDDHTPSEMPTLFLTGYRITFAAGAPAKPRDWPKRSWVDWLKCADYPRGYIIIRKANSTLLLKAAPDGSIPHVMPDDFDPHGITYRQLTPDGSTP